VETSLQFIRHVPPALKAKLIAEAEERGSNMNDVAVRALSKRYKVKVEGQPQTRKTTPNPEGTDMMLRIPVGLHRAIRVAAAETGRSAPREILVSLCKHYDVLLDAARVAA
jgi:predicted HicB family RNase H-like nuclease